MALRVSTTGSDVFLYDLGVILTHPTTDRDLALEFTSVELRDSSDLTDAIQSGDLSVDDGINFIHQDDYDPDELLIQELGVRNDALYISHDELASKGDIYIVSGIFPLSLNSTASSTKNVYSPGGRFITWQVDAKDKLVISDSIAADGTYTVDTVSDQQNLIVEESIPNSTGGTIEIFHPNASSRIGVDDSDYSNMSGDTLEEILDSIDAGLTTSSGINANSHRDLDQLVHNIAEDSFEDILRVGNKVTNITIWTDSSKTTKIREEQYVYSGNKVITAIMIQYNAVGVEVERITDTFNYSGNFVASIDRELT